MPQWHPFSMKTHVASLYTVENPNRGRFEIIVGWEQILCKVQGFLLEKTLSSPAFIALESFRLELYFIFYFWILRSREVYLIVGKDCIIVTIKIFSGPFVYALTRNVSIWNWCLINSLTLESFPLPGWDTTPTMWRNRWATCLVGSFPERSDCVLL